MKTMKMMKTLKMTKTMRMTWKKMISLENWLKMKPMSNTLKKAQVCLLHVLVPFIGSFLAHLSEIKNICAKEVNGFLCF
jgi:hypothetical protein